jgi:TorA maturation chaperone TorD
MLKSKTGIAPGVEAERRKAAAAVFQILAECFKRPQEQFVTQLRTGQVDQELRNLTVLAGYTVESIDFACLAKELSLMAADYDRCLAGIFPPFVLPVESLYKRWTEDPSAQVAIASSKGYLWGDSALHIQYLLVELQLKIPEEYAQMPDHLALLLELLAYMLTMRPRAECQDFLTDHFDWLTDLAEAVRQFPGHKFFSYALDMTQAAIQSELQHHDGREADKV